MTGGTTVTIYGLGDVIFTKPTKSTHKILPFVSPQNFDLFSVKFWTLRAIKAFTTSFSRKRLTQLEILPKLPEIINIT